MTSGPILFIGDSVTDCGRRDDAPDYLGDGYVRMVAEKLPGRRVINVGISGNRVVNLRDRWHIDVVEQKPEILSVYIGINDTWRRYDDHDRTTTESFEADYRECLADLGGARALILVEPFVLPVTKDQEIWHEDLDGKRAVVAQLAAEFGAGFVPLQSLLAAAAENHGAAALAPDGVHPTELGHRMIADAWLDVAGV
ncbi:MAG TPA: SGNH/GDSL hydrolase family protein [Galbitalea sp.]|jgi:lysophospholipase L1-like esterase|nr:SGNH/GDSL hydrolase family protein [Galbitalea sp.]